VIRIRALIKLRGRTLVIGAALALICLALAWAHSAPAAHEMNASGDDQMADVISICLAVLQIGGGLLAALIGTVLVRRRRPPRRLSPTIPANAVFGRGLVYPVAARAGPALIQVFRR
jgi:hypothetical protein